MALTPESLYRQLGRLIETMPDLTVYPLSAESHIWLGRADALIHASGNISDGITWRTAVSRLGTMMASQGLEEIKLVLYRALASAELKAPAGAKGSFIPAGNSFDAYTALAKVLQLATRDAFIVDPYMDETVLTEFGQAVPDGIPLRLLADGNDHKPTLLPAAKKWTLQHGGRRPLAVRLANPRSLHDRAIFIDGATAWTLTQSLKDFAKRSPAEIVRADDTAGLKIAAYEDIWAKSTVVV